MAFASLAVSPWGCSQLLDEVQPRVDDQRESGEHHQDWGDKEDVGKPHLVPPSCLRRFSLSILEFPCFSAFFKSRAIGPALRASPARHSISALCAGKLKA